MTELYPKLRPEQRRFASENRPPRLPPLLHTKERKLSPHWSLKRFLTGCWNRGAVKSAQRGAVEPRMHGARTWYKEKPEYERWQP